MGRSWCLAVLIAAVATPGLCSEPLSAENADQAAQHVLAGRVFMQEGRFDQAAEAFLSAIEIAPGFAPAHYLLGNAHMSGQQLVVAKDAYRAAIELEPELTAAHYQLGQAHMATGRYTDAIDAYLACRRSILARRRLTPEEREALELQRSVSKLRMAASLDALAKAPAVGRIVPSLRDLELVGRMAMMQKESRLEKRIRAVEAADGDLSVPAELQLALGSAYLRAGQLAAAELAYGGALKADQTKGAANNNLAVIYLKTGRLEEAELAVERAAAAGFPVPAGLEADIQRRKAGSPNQAP